MYTHCSLSSMIQTSIYIISYVYMYIYYTQLSLSIYLSLYISCTYICMYIDMYIYIYIWVDAGSGPLLKQRVAVRNNSETYVFHTLVQKCVRLPSVWGVLRFQVQDAALTSVGIAQWVGHLPRDLQAPGSIPGLGTFWWCGP